MDPLTDRLNRLERKIDLLTWVALGQALLLIILAGSFLLQMTRYLLLAIVILIPLAFVFRKSIPGWCHAIGRRIGMFTSPAVPPEPPNG